MFEKVVAAPADPILGLTEEFKKDARAEKINLGVGIYKNEQGETPVLATVKKAEAALIETEKNQILPNNRRYSRIRSSSAKTAVWRRC